MASGQENLTGNITINDGQEVKMPLQSPRDTTKIQIHGQDVSRDSIVGSAIPVLNDQLPIHTLLPGNTEGGEITAATPRYQIIGEKIAPLPKLTPLPNALPEPVLPMIVLPQFSRPPTGVSNREVSSIQPVGVSSPPPRRSLPGPEISPRFIGVSNMVGSLGVSIGVSDSSPPPRHPLGPESPPQLVGVLPVPSTRVPTSAFTGASPGKLVGGSRGELMGVSDPSPLSPRQVLASLSADELYRRFPPPPKEDTASSVRSPPVSLPAPTTRYQPPPVTTGNPAARGPTSARSSVLIEPTPPVLTGSLQPAVLPAADKLIGVSNSSPPTKPPSPRQMGHARTASVPAGASVGVPTLANSRGPHPPSPPSPRTPRVSFGNESDTKDDGFPELPRADFGSADFPVDTVTYHEQSSAKPYTSLVYSRSNNLPPMFDRIERDVRNMEIKIAPSVKHHPDESDTCPNFHVLSPANRHAWVLWLRQKAMEHGEKFKNKPVEVKDEWENEPERLQTIWLHLSYQDRLIAKRKSNINTKIMIGIGFFVTEIVAIKLGLDFKDFTIIQLENMEQYNDIIDRIGELSLLDATKHSNPWMQLLFVYGLNVVIFAVVQWLTKAVNPTTAKTLLNMLLDLPKMMGFGQVKIDGMLKGGINIAQKFIDSKIGPQAAATPAAAAAPAEQKNSDIPKHPRRKGPSQSGT